MTRFAWIPEAPKHPGLYANLSDDFDPTRSIIRGERQPSTMDPNKARQFATKEECQAWCDANPSPVFEPREHGFWSADDGAEAAEVSGVLRQGEGT